MNNLLTEQLKVIRRNMGILTEETLTVSGNYTAPKGDGDALHSFERRKSDGFGGRMTTKIEEKLKELYDKGINPDIYELNIRVDSTNYKVDWDAKVGPSKDGKAYMGVSTRGSAGGGADTRAKGQIPKLKSELEKNGAEDITEFLDFKNPTGVYIRQYFLKYTLPKKYPPHGSDSVTSTETKTKVKDSEFDSWDSGEYKLEGNPDWTFRLTTDKDWEGKKSGGSYVSLSSKLSDDEMKTALESLKKSKKI